VLLVYLVRSADREAPFYVVFSIPLSPRPSQAQNLTQHPILEYLQPMLLNNNKKYTGLFISPSGISDPCGTVAGMVTPKGNMSTEGETLQISVLPYRCSIC